MSKLILFNKPYRVLCQFSGEDGRENLSDFISEPHVYPAGRLDADSEGLLLLTDDGQLQHQISHPKHKLTKTYWVQVEGIPNKESILNLSQGVELKDGLTLPAKVKAIEPPLLWARKPPVRERLSVPDSWLEISIKEGKNRQVRRMTAAVGLPTLRLIRVQIGQWSLKDLQPGEWRMEQVHMPRNNRRVSSPTRNTTTRKNKTKDRTRHAKSD